MSAIVVYLIGVIVAFYLIAKHISRNSENEIECSGFVLGYAFSLLSWVTVIIILIVMLDRKRHGTLIIPEKDLHID